MVVILDTSMEDVVELDSTMHDVAFGACAVFGQIVFGQTAFGYSILRGAVVLNTTMSDEVVTLSLMED